MRCEIGAIGDRALRVRGRGDEHRDRARKQLFGERVEVGKKARGRGGRQIDRLAVRCGRAGGIGGIEGIGNQHGRAAASATDPARRSDGGEKQALARAVQHQDFMRRVDRPRQGKASAEPAGGGLAQRVDAFVHGVAAELGDMGRKNRAHERRHGMLRLAHREADRGLARFVIAQQFAQPHEGRAANICPGGRGRGLAFGGGHEHRQKRRQHPPHQRGPTIGAAR